LPNILVALIFALVFIFPNNVFALEKQEHIKIFQERIPGMIKRAILPIIDTEFHHGGGVEIESLIKAMDENGVALIWLAPVLKLGSEESVRLSASYPDRFVPTTVNGDSKKWHSGNKAFLNKLAKDVRSGKYFAMGEFEARHYPSSTNTRDVYTPVDSDGMQVVFQLASETGLPFSLHHEAEDALLPELERMLAKYPKAKVIWCHVGRNRNYETWKKFRKADAVREYLSKYPNLYFDFLQSRPGSKYRYDGKGYGKEGYVEGIMYDYSASDVALNAEWKKVIEDFPDRFVLGSDANTGGGMEKFEKYERVTYIFRDIILKGVKPDVAEKIAYKNAWKLMTGKDWQD
jgi:predicted TIM-barrel fold metal-dependent hydrolase